MAGSYVRAGVETRILAVGDSEFVTVQEADQTVRVARMGDLINVHY